MTTIKTAISIQKSLFEQVDRLAKELNVPRSRVFVMAVEDFIKHYQNQQMLDKINQVYDELPAYEGQILADKMRKNQRRMVDGEW